MSLTIETLIQKDTGFAYRDLNRNGVLDPFEDTRLSTEERVKDLVGRLSLEEKAGLMFHTSTSVPKSGDPKEEIPRIGGSTVAQLIGKKSINHINLHYIPAPRKMANWVNEMQLAAITASPHGIPLSFSTDPRHSFSENFGASFVAENFSAWPEALGFAALGDEDTVFEHARTARSEYRAVGIHAALHPTLDLATEPRWARQYSTFGQDADMVSRLARAYLDGFEGSQLGDDSIACMVKHFPGGGPQLDGEDPHFPYGREQVYPGKQFEYHLQPFREMIARGVSAIMPYYGMPVELVRNGQEIEQVGFGYNKQVVTGILREELGYEGVVCTDWGLVTQSALGGKVLPPRAWGVEHLSVEERVLKIIEAGCDQLGGEERPEVVVDLVTKGFISEERINESAARLLRVKFDLGLFDSPFVDEDTADARTKTPAFVEAGLRAQARSTTILKNEDSVLPLTPQARVYSADIPDSILSAGGLKPVESPAEAELAIVRVEAPYEARDEFMLEDAFRAGHLNFENSVIASVKGIAEKVPVILVVHLDRPAILADLEPHIASLVAVYGTSDEALVRALTNVVRPEGRLPFSLPRNMADVEKSHSDVGGGFDSLYEYGDGLDLRPAVGSIS